MEVDLTCTYCDHKWITFVATKRLLNDLICPKCGDASLKVKNTAEIVKIDYYQGSPPFPDGKTKEQELQDELAEMYGGLSY